MNRSLSTISTCPKLINNPNLAKGVDLHRYGRLHPDGRQLIYQWFKRAWRQRDASQDKCFEPFIYTWFAFNAWAACVTELDIDRQWRDALSLNSELCEKFNTLVEDSDSILYSHAKDFYEIWPIFKSQEIRRQSAQYSGFADRQDIISHYFIEGIPSFEPKCWKTHHDGGEEVPYDWPHTLAALYRVRCNLFHGEKGLHSEIDHMVVSRAFRVLVHFLNEAIFSKHLPPELS